MYQFEKIKLVIWDLDETFWHGTLTEGGAVIPHTHRVLLKDLTDIGIVNSICSKNDWEPVAQELEKQELLQYFVFPSVNWDSKGNRVKDLIADMQLRPANVLFIDDNHSNREEVRYFCPEIMVADPAEIPLLIEDVAQAPKKDKDHKRLKQYRVLEEKRASRQSYSSNEAFLAESNIRLDISTDCMDQLPRIHDLLLRSNHPRPVARRCVSGGRRPVSRLVPVLSADQCGRSGQRRTLPSGPDPRLGGGRPGPCHAQVPGQRR